MNERRGRPRRNSSSQKEPKAHSIPVSRRINYVETLNFNNRRTFLNETRTQHGRFRREKINTLNALQTEMKKSIPVTARVFSGLKRLILYEMSLAQTEQYEQIADSMEQLDRGTLSNGSQKYNGLKESLIRLRRKEIALHRLFQNTNRIEKMAEEMIRTGNLPKLPVK